MTLLLDVLTINTGLAGAVVAAVIASVTAIILAFLRYANNNEQNNREQIIIKLNEIVSNQRAFELEIRPLAIQIAEHAVEIRNLKDRVNEVDGWISNHDTRIQHIEKVVNHL